MKVFVFLLQFAVCITAMQFGTSEMDYNMWKKEYNIVEEKCEYKYIPCVHTYVNYVVWKDNINKINDHNVLNTFKMAPNKFTGMTNREFKNYVKGYSNGLPTDTCEKIQPPAFINKFANSVKNTPAIDWRTKGVVASVKDQRDCGSCWAFSAVSAIESLWAIKKGVLYDLSEQQLVDCSADEGNDGCFGGLMDYAFNYTIQRGGLCTDEDYPYSGIDEECDIVCTRMATITGCINIIVGNNFTERAMEMALELNPISVAVNAGNLLWQNYHSGIISGAACTPDVDHGVVIVGLNETSSGQKYWIIKNSWSEDWGMQGYAYLERGTNMCGVTVLASMPYL